MAPVGRAFGAQYLYCGEKEAGRASCVRGKMGAERRMDAENEKKRCCVGGAFGGGDGARGRGGRD